MLVVLGGDDGVDLSIAEVLDFDLGTCSPDLPDLPSPSSYPVGMADAEGSPAFCGGTAEPGKCFVLRQGAGRWEEMDEGPLRRGRYGNVYERSYNKYFVP